jgi:hypothetical protein
MDECDKGEEMNIMEEVSNNGEKISKLFFFFFIQLQGYTLV